MKGRKARQKRRCSREKEMKVGRKEGEHIKKERIKKKSK